MTFNYSSIAAPDRAVLHWIANSALSTVQGVEHTFLTARHVLLENVPGVFVECGVAFGGQVGSMSQALKSTGQRRPVHLFDSFAGIPLAGPHDHDQPGIGHHIADVNLPLEKRLVSSGVSVGSTVVVRENLGRWGFDLDYVYHPGWFQHTLPVTPVPDIALLRLDGDLYESTQVCLQYLYPRVVNNGWIIIDDYPLPGCRKAVDEYLKEHGLKPEVLTPVDCGIACWRIKK